MYTPGMADADRRVVYLPDDLWKALRAEADRIGCSASFIVRECLAVRLSQDSIDAITELAAGLQMFKPVERPKLDPRRGQIRLSSGEVVNLDYAPNSEPQG